MKVDGWILDVRFTEDRAALWVRTPDRGRVKLHDRYNPEFYAAPDGMDAARLRDLLEEHDNIKDISVERRNASIGSPDGVEVVRIRVDRFENYRRLRWEVERMPGVAETYDADIEHELKYLCDRGLAPWTGSPSRPTAAGGSTPSSRLPGASMSSLRLCTSSPSG